MWYKDGMAEPNAASIFIETLRKYIVEGDPGDINEINIVCNSEDEVVAFKDYIYPAYCESGFDRIFDKAIQFSPLGSFIMWDIYSACGET